MRKPGTGEAYDKLRYLLIEARKRIGLKQTDLAKRLERNQAFVTRYETGRTSVGCD
jgi:ribosome-binding protein aMBF1 (putative translation factor)